MGLVYSGSRLVGLGFFELKRGERGKSAISSAISQ